MELGRDTDGTRRLHTDHAEDPLLMDKTQLDPDLRRMQNQADTFDASKAYHATVVSQGNRMIGTLTATIEALEAAAGQVRETSARRSGYT